MHVVDETPLPVDLHDRDPLAVCGFQLRVSVDRHLAQLEADLVPRGGDDAPSRRAQVAARSGEENDLGYG